MSADFTEDHNVQLWRYDDDLATFDPSAIVPPSWLPDEGDGWVEIREGVGRSFRIGCSEGERGYTVSFTVFGESRLEWEEGKPMALVASHWTATDGEGAPALVCWGYLRGEGESALEKNGRQTGARSFSFASSWDRIAVAPDTLGRTNLMQGATFDAAKSVAALATPASEVQYGEYASAPADVTGAAAIDQNSDTPAISSLTAEAAPAVTYGNTVAGGRPVPRVAMVYAGTSSRVVGAGDEPILFVLVCRAQLFTWGSFADRALVPAFYEEDDGPTYPAEKNGTLRNTAFVVGGGRNGGNSLRVRCKANVAADNNIRIGIQWNTQSAWVDLPALATFWIKAGEAGSIGKLVRATIKPADPGSGAGSPLVIALTSDYRRYQIPLDSLGSYGGVMLRFQNEAGEVASDDCVFELAELEVIAGYSDELHAVATNTRFHFAYDDEDGHSEYVRVAWDLLPANWSIPPGGAVVIANDASVFGAKFERGDFQVASTRARAPYLYFNPGVGRLKTSFAQNTVGLDYDDSPAGGTLIEEILFAGLTWDQGANPQMLRRESPLFTGAFVAEDYPTLTLDIASTFGPSYWTYALPTYTPPVLTDDLTDTALVALVENTDHYESAGVVLIDDELVEYDQTEEGAIHLVTRGYNPAGAPFVFPAAGAPAAHTAGARVYPWRDGAEQLGQLVADVELRRKAGTARMLDGFVLYSNEIDPGSPSPDFELTAGGVWKVYGRFANNQGDTVRLTAPGAPYVEARWLSFAVRSQEYYLGDPQRGKVNEVLAWAFRPGAASSGRYRSLEVATSADAVGYLLTKHAQLDPDRYLPATSGAPISTLPIARGTLAEALSGVAALGGLVVLADGYGRAMLVAKPGSPYFTPPTVSRIWTAAEVREGVRVRWLDRDRVGQVLLVAREVGALRTHAIRYPDVPGARGKVLEVKDVAVPNVAVARAHARALFNQGNTQRVPPLVVGYVPDLQLFDRHLVNLPDADAGDQLVGVNTYVAAFTIEIKPGPHGSTLWRTSLDLQELAL